MRPDEYLELNEPSLHELDWAEKAWLRAAMDDFNTALKNTTEARLEYETYVQNLVYRDAGDIINVEQHERRRRAHSIILTTFWTLLYEMKRVNGCMLQRAQEFIQHAVGYDMPEDTPQPRRLLLETAIRLLQARCLCFETFHEHLPSIYRRLEQFYDNINWRIPNPDRPASTRAWTDQLFKCCRCKVYHSPVSLVCTPILGVYTPTPTAANAAAHEPQRANAPATRRPITTATWVYPSVPDGRVATRPLRVDTDGAFDDLDHDTEEDRSARAEAARRGPLPMPDLAREDGSLYVPEEDEQPRTSHRDDPDFEPYDAEQWTRGPRPRANDIIPEVHPEQLAQIHQWGTGPLRHLLYPAPRTESPPTPITGGYNLPGDNAPAARTINAPDRLSRIDGAEPNLFTAQPGDGEQDPCTRGD
jgi:hypothetical protein